MELKRLSFVWKMEAETGLDRPKASARMKRIFTLLIPIAACLLASACAAGSTDSAHAASSGFIAEFVLGLWHGIISPITLLVEIINSLLPHVLPWRPHLYETRAAGAPYDLGFYLGLGGGPVIAWRRWR